MPIGSLKFILKSVQFACVHFHVDVLKVLFLRTVNFIVLIIMKGILVSLVIVSLSCYAVQADELMLSSSLNQSPTLKLTPCLDNTDCENFINGVCLNGFCECNGTKFCQDKVTTIVTKIGEICKIDDECNIEHSVCKEDKCACVEGNVEAFDGRKCLMVVAALGDTCEDSIQCYIKVRHSDCQNEKCICQQEMHEYEGACFRNVALEGDCQLPEECSATTNATCVDRKCVCNEGYVQNQAANRCLNVAAEIGGPCNEDIQCSTKFGKAYCKQGRCQCDELYQLKSSKSMCVRDMLLGEFCQNHTDCRGPEEGESRSECILGVCKCKSEFYEEHGFCASAGITFANVPSVLLYLVLLLRVLIF